MAYPLSSLPYSMTAVEARRRLRNRHMRTIPATFDRGCLFVFSLKTEEEPEKRWRWAPVDGSRVLCTTVDGRQKVRSSEELFSGMWGESLWSHNEHEVAGYATSGLAGIAKTTPDLVPTTFKMMGNVLYLHTPTGKVLMEVGNLSPSEPGTKLDLGAIKAIGNEASRSANNPINLVNENEDQLLHAIEDASVIRTPKSDVGDHKDASEVLTRESRRGYKQLVRNQRVKIEPEHNYSPGEVAAALNLSYDSALRRMPKMKGVADFGTPTRRYKRGKRKLRISGRNLLAYIRTKTVV